MILEVGRSLPYYGSLGFSGVSTTPIPKEPILLSVGAKSTYKPE
jgi:hypothetical protein